MYNINKFIDQKYGTICFILITCILIIVFLNSRQIVEGLTAKQKRAKKVAEAKKVEAKKVEAKKVAEAEKKAEATAATTSATAAEKKAEATAATTSATAATTSATAAATATYGGVLTTSGVTDANVGKVSAPVTSRTSASIKSMNTKIDNTIKRRVAATLPSIVARSIAIPIADIKKKQGVLSSEIKNILDKQTKLNDKMSETTANIETTSRTNNEKINTTYSKLSSDLQGQYDMQKTGLSTQVTDATKAIKNMNTNIMDSAEKANEAKNEAKQYADLSNKIYTDVFGAATTRVIQQDIQGFTPMNTSDGYIQPNNLFDLEKDLVDKLNAFNVIYYNYIRCSSGGTTDCGTKNTLADVNTSSDAVITAITALKTAYSSANIATTDTDTLFQSNHNEILDKSKSIDELRRNLDTRMQAILKSKTPPNEMTQQYDSTVYTGIMWSVLATSVLFYIFTEL